MEYFSSLPEDRPLEYLPFSQSLEPLCSRQPGVENQNVSLQCIAMTSMFFTLLIFSVYYGLLFVLQRDLRVLGVDLVELDIIAGEEGEEDVLHTVVVLLVDVLVADLRIYMLMSCKATTRAILIHNSKKKV